MANKIIKGRDLMLFDDKGKSFAYATNHTLTIEAETSDISSKDHGIWSATEVSKYTWEITSENLFTEETYANMFDAMIAANPITVRFGLKKDEKDPSLNPAVVDSSLTAWSSQETYYTGQVLIRSIVANANNGENATLSITLTGVNALKRVGTVS